MGDHSSEQFSPETRDALDSKITIGLTGDGRPLLLKLAGTVRNWGQPGHDRPEKTDVELSVDEARLLIERLRRAIERAISPDV